jgi:glycosyltransferase involved in cell wall biosynthesis
MPDQRYRLLIVSTHVVQYMPALFRQMAQDPRLDVQVAYCSLLGAKAGVDPEFGVEMKWDVPLLDGYPWVHVPNRSPRPGLGRFFGLINPGLWKRVRAGRFDSVLCYTGYAYLSFWILAAAAKLSGVLLLASTDAHNLRSPHAKWWKTWIKRRCLPAIYGLFDVVLAPSQATIRFLKSLGIPEQRIHFAPGGFDNEGWARRAKPVDRAAARDRLGILRESSVFLFCAKLQPWKRPQDLLRAFARLEPREGFLIFAGDGPLRPALEAEAKVLGVADRVAFLGFVNQSRLPELYRAADVLVLPSEYDGCPLVVCEAMSCGCPVVLSDAIPGRFELVRHGETGFVYPSGDVDALATVLRQVAQNPQQLQQLARAAVEQMKAWSLCTYTDGLVRAIDQAMRRRRAAGEPEAISLKQEA